MRPGAYSPAEVETAARMRRVGASAAQIGAELGRSVGSVKFMLQRTGIPLGGRPRKGAGYVPVDRECLSCLRGFRAETRFLRMCKRCRVNN